MLQLELTRFRGHIQSKEVKGGIHDGKKDKRQYPPEFRQEIVGLVRSGRSPEALAREFEPLGFGDPGSGSSRPIWTRGTGATG